MSTINIETFNKKCNKSYLYKVKNNILNFKVDLCFVHRYVPFLIDFYIKNIYEKDKKIK
jgi:hypothetical protein